MAGAAQQTRNGAFQIEGRGWEYVGWGTLDLKCPDFDQERPTSGVRRGISGQERKNPVGRAPSFGVDWTSPGVKWRIFSLERGVSGLYGRVFDLDQDVPGLEWRPLQKSGPPDPKIRTGRTSLPSGFSWQVPTPSESKDKIARYRPASWQNPVCPYLYPSKNAHPTHAFLFALFARFFASRPRHRCPGAARSLSHDGTQPHRQRRL